MTPTYTCLPSIEYINGLSYDYIETYSFQRGIDFEEKNKVLKDKYDNLTQRKQNFNNLTPDEEIFFQELYKLFTFTQYLVGENEVFHHSSKKTNTFKYNNANTARVRKILETEINQTPNWLCSPIYRDAIVFYDNNNKIVSTLNICLSCQYMETKIFNHITCDYKTYELFKQFFIDIGHEVEKS